MASKPGLLTDWPWTPLGNFKYLVLAPGTILYIWSYLTSNAEEADITPLITLPFLLFRMLHNQFWISFSRYRTANGRSLIVDKSIEFDQVDRERNWDDQIIFTGVLFYVGFWAIEETKRLPVWRTDGVIISMLLHMGPVEFLYYWLHRALHHHYLYSRYHSHHHSSIVTEPITSVIHPFAEHVSYFLLFAIPFLTTAFTSTMSLASMGGYLLYIDFMNNMGHCNFELIPKTLFTLFPPLKYIMYTPPYHSLHHTQFRTNYSLFMPFYDYVYGTMDRSTDMLYNTSLEKPQHSLDVVYLTHLTTLQSIYQSRLGFASLSSDPLSPKWYLWLMWPITLWSMILTLIYGGTFVLDANTFEKLRLQSWSIPRYTLHYSLKWQRVAINKLIEKAVLEADGKNVKVLSLGLSNQSHELNQNGEYYIQKYPKLKVKLVDGSSLAVAVILNSIPKETTKIVFRAKLSKIAYSIVSTLCHKGIEVATLRQDEYEKLKISTHPEYSKNLILFKGSTYKTWLVGEDMTEEEQSMASNGTMFVPIDQFPPKKGRKDCFYLYTPAMVVPNSLGNLHTCENWLPRRVMSAWRVAGIVHAMEGWKVNECGDTLFDVDQVWEAALTHGFRPLQSHFPLA